MRSFVLGAVLLVALTMPAMGFDDDDDDDVDRTVLRGGQILFQLGVFEPHGDSELWDVNEALMTQDMSDFDDAIVGLGFAMPLASHLDIMFGAQYYGAETKVRYQDIFALDGDSIRQHHTLREIPLEVSFKLFPVPRETSGPGGRRRLNPIVPYLGGGAGALAWSYEERGNFVDDPETPTFAFHDNRYDSGVTGSYHALAGVEINFTKEFAMWMEGRYRWASADLGSDFDDDLDRFDLSGGSISIGASVRF